MTNDDKILNGLREVYKQNAEILKLLKGVVGESVPTATHEYPPKSKDKPWEKWTNKAEQKTNTDEEFKL
jgi:hypothetical protein